jgi:hypothetical protein
VTLDPIFKNMKNKFSAFCLCLISAFSFQLSALASSFWVTNDLTGPVAVAFYATNAAGQFTFGALTTNAVGTSNSITAGGSWNGVAVVQPASSAARVSSFAALVNTNGANCSYLTTNGYATYYTLVPGAGGPGSISAGSAFSGGGANGTISGTGSNSAPALAVGASYYYVQTDTNGNVISPANFHVAGGVTNGGSMNGSFSGTFSNNFNYGFNNYAQSTFDGPPKGLNGWFGAFVGPYSNIGLTETNIINEINLMATNGMVANGYNLILMDRGAFGNVDTIWPSVTNMVGYAAMTNAQGVMDLQPTSFPHGGQYLFNYAHTNGVKLGLYMMNWPTGTAPGWNIGGTNLSYASEPGFFGNDVYLRTLTNVILNWQCDYIKDDQSGAEPFSYGYGQQEMSIISSLTAITRHPCFVNIAAVNGYQPWMRGLFNSWRIGLLWSADVNNLNSYYTWLDHTPFQVSSPGYLNDLDELHPTSYAYTPNGSVFAGQLENRNQIAMDAMVNSALLLGVGTETSERATPLMYGWYYDDYDNPLVNSIDNDFASHVQTLSSNALMLVYGKTLADGTWVVCAMNRSATTPQTAVITSPYPNEPVFTLHEVFRNAPFAIATNVYTVTVGTNDVGWYKLVPGIEQPFAAGTNLLANFPWSGAYQPYTGVAWAVNNFPNTNSGYPTGGFPGIQNGITNYTGIKMGDAATNYVSWTINGNATLFTVCLNANQSGGYWIIGDGNVLWSGAVGANSYTNLALNVTGVNVLTISSTNAAGWHWIGDPTLVCPTQTKYDVNGNATTISSVAATTIQPASITSGAAGAGSVLTANGAGGSSYQPVSANGSQTFELRTFVTTGGTTANFGDGSGNYSASPYYTQPYLIMNGNTFQHPVPSSWTNMIIRFSYEWSGAVPLTWTNSMNSDTRVTGLGRFQGGSACTRVFTLAANSITYVNYTNTWPDTLNTNVEKYFYFTGNAGGAPTNSSVNVLVTDDKAWYIVSPNTVN